MPYIQNPDKSVKPQPMSYVNNSLPNGRDYDIMYLGNAVSYSNPASSAQKSQNNSENAKNNETYVTYGYADENVVGGIQLRLNELGYSGANGNGIKISGIFDENTEAGIKKFQEYRGLPVTGIFDEATKKEMGFLEDYSVSRKGKNATPWMPPESSPFNAYECDPFNEIISERKEIGLWSEDKEAVKAIQYFLLQNNYLDANGKPLKIDGIFGPATEFAVKRYQKEHLLTVDGIVGPATIASMADYVSTPGSGYPIHYTKVKDDAKFSDIFSWIEAAKFLHTYGGAQPFSPEAELIYDEYQKNIENDLQELVKKYGQQAIQIYIEGLKSQNQ